MPASQSPFGLLLSYQQRALAIRADIPQENSEREVWSGLAFRLGEQVLLAPMVEVEEIVDAPVCTRVPNTQPWFLGIGNVRGNLVAVSDLYAFAYRAGMLDRRESRVLICSSGDSTIGIVVDEILGLRRFFVDEKVRYKGGVSEVLLPFIKSAFEREQQIYPLFQLQQFINSSNFLRVEKA